MLPAALRHPTARGAVDPPASHGDLELTCFPGGIRDCQQLLMGIGLNSEDSILDFSEDAANDGWRGVHPRHWSRDQVLDWVYSSETLPGVDHGSLRGEAFQQLTGVELVAMSRAEFIARDPLYGDQLYHSLQTLRDDYDGVDYSEFEDCFLDYLNDDEALHSSKSLSPIPHEYDYQAANGLPSFATFFRRSESGDTGFESEVHSHEIDMSEDSPSEQSPPCLLDISSSSSSSSGQFFTLSPPAPSPPIGALPTLPRRKKGRPRKEKPPSESSSSDGEGGGGSGSGGGIGLPGRRQSRRNGRGNKSMHLWEFMLLLLANPAYNPQCIKWENEAQGVFRIVPGQSKVIAGLWGQRKNNPTMTFDKLSRSLRWCRTFGFLSEVPKNDGYPKKLCFRFGDKALEWHRGAAS